ncbi:MAG: DUF6580 family putative transport protein [Patescibacteria group bacterium]|nr:DUF6580 family putative transport protein [Patescibacteria group bacterium]
MNKVKLVIALVMIIIGVVGRFILVSYAGIPNLEIITVLALIAGIYLGGVYAVAVPLSVIFLSDLVIGNTYIFIFTWTAFAMIGLFGYASRRIQNSKLTGGNALGRKIQNSLYLALLSSVFFYIYTNFGWWLMSGMYEYSLSGILRCYYMAIPFFRNNLVGNLIFVPVGIYVASKVFCNIESYNISKILLQEKKVFRD